MDRRSTRSIAEQRHTSDPSLDDGSILTFRRVFGAAHLVRRRSGCVARSEMQAFPVNRA